MRRGLGWVIATGLMAGSLPAAQARSADAATGGRPGSDTTAPAGTTDTAGHRQTLLVLGDSLSAEYGIGRGQGWVALLQRRLADQHAGWDVANASVSGETTAGGASRIDALLKRHAPALVVIELGGNDALRGLDLQATRSNLDRMVRASRQAGAQVLVVGMKLPPNYGRAYGEDFERIFAEAATANGVQLLPFLLDGIAERSDLFQPDRIHPTAAAQPRMLDNVWQHLAPMLATPPGR